MDSKFIPKIMKSEKIKSVNGDMSNFLDFCGFSGVIGIF